MENILSNKVTPKVGRMGDFLKNLIQKLKFKPL